MKKIGLHDVMKMAYSTYKNMLKESEETQQHQEQQYITPVDFHPSFYKGTYYFNVSIRDKKLFSYFLNFPTEMADRAQRAAQKKDKEFTDKDFDRVKDIYRVASNSDIPEEKEWVILGVRIIDPNNLLTPDGKMNQASSDVKRIYHLLMSLGKVMPIDDDECRNAILTTAYYVTNRHNDAKTKDIEDEMRNLFFEICKTIGEEKTQQLLQSVNIKNDDYITDHQFSLRNKLRIIAQATIYDKNGDNQVNTISYLATPRQWRKMGRRVVDFTHPYHTVTFNGGRGSQAKELEYAKGKGFVPIPLKEGVRNNIGFAAGKGLNAATNADLYGRKSFSYNDALYDVQATEVIGGAQDKFTEEPGMKNNLTGELNDVATQRLQTLNPNSEINNNDERTQKLNDLFGTTNYDEVDLTYQAICQTANAKDVLPKDATAKEKIKVAGDLIDKMLIEHLRSFKKGGGHIAMPKNYLPLIPIGRIIIQSSVGLPMDSAPAMQWAEEHKKMTDALSETVFQIIRQILHNKIQINQSLKQNVSEMFKIYSPLVIFEETYNKALKLIRENAEI